MIPHLLNYEVITFDGESMRSTSTISILFEKFIT